MNQKHIVTTFTKKDIAQRVASARKVNSMEAARWVDDVLTAMRTIMMEADPELRIEVRDFGVFEVKLTKSKPKARNPRTGEIVFVPPRRKTHCKPSKLLKAFLSKPINGELKKNELVQSKN